MYFAGRGRGEPIAPPPLARGPVPNGILGVRPGSQPQMNRVVNQMNNMHLQNKVGLKTFFFNLNCCVWQKVRFIYCFTFKITLDITKTELALKIASSSKHFGQKESYSLT
jgi:hypothetical protein